MSPRVREPETTKPVVAPAASKTLPPQPPGAQLTPMPRERPDRLGRGPSQSDRSAARSLQADLLDPSRTAAALKAKVADASPGAIVAALADPLSGRRLADLSIDYVALPRISGNDEGLRLAAESDAFAAWLLAHRATDRFLIAMARVGSVEALRLLTTGPAWPALAKALVESGPPAGPLQAALRQLFTLAPDADLAVRVMEVRFGVPFGVVGGLGAIEGPKPFDREVLPDLWTALERLPAGHLRQPQLAGFVRDGLREGDEPHGQYHHNVPRTPAGYVNRIALQYRLATAAGPSELARPGDKLHGVNLMQRVITHEVGHAVAQGLGINVDDPRSPFVTERPFGLWRKEPADTLPAAVRERKGDDDRRWREDPPIVNGRAYTHRQGNFWSYDATLRRGARLSDYAFSTPGELFAEIYAAYYLTAPEEPGKLVKAWRPQVYEWFVEHVANATPAGGVPANPR